LPSPYETPKEEHLVAWEVTFSASELRMSYEAQLLEQSRGAMIAICSCIECDRSRLGGIPVLVGTRFPVYQLIAELADSESVAEIADDFELDKDVLRKLLHAMAVHWNKPFRR
jgi:uncharacterized protein (DUF433 family)